MCKPVFHAGRSEISVIKFDGIKVRVVNINGEPWFVGADVCAALEISNVTDAVSALDNDEVMTLTLTEGHSGKRGGARSWNVVSESGCYKLIARSRKAASPGTFAHRFSNWVFREVNRRFGHRDHQCSDSDVHLQCFGADGSESGPD
ncbi:transporter [Salmonella enterica subsp. enterica]|nr:transporter [Salmonella enterica]ECH8371632.1 transporter [Salmonella enterica subsp. enterica]